MFYLFQIISNKINVLIFHSIFLLSFHSINYLFNFKERRYWKKFVGRQKSRVFCIKEGDRNTKFFHRMANSHRRFNSIDKLKVDGVMSFDQGSIAECITHFYRRLYSKNEVHSPVLDDVQFGRIFEEEALWLDRHFEEDEVFGVVSGFNGDKSPAPDGFSMAFFSILLEHFKIRHYGCPS